MNDPAARPSRRPPRKSSTLLKAIRSLSAAQQRTAAAAIVVLVSLGTPWYSTQVVSDGKKVDGTMSGISAFSFVEAAVLLVAVAVLALVWGRATDRRFSLPVADGTVITAAAGWIGLLVVYRLFDKPATGIDKGTSTFIGLSWGIFASLAAVGLLLATGLDQRRRDAELRASTAAPADGPVVDPEDLVDPAVGDAGAAAGAAPGLPDAPSGRAPEPVPGGPDPAPRRPDEAQPAAPRYDDRDPRPYESDRPAAPRYDDRDPRPYADDRPAAPRYDDRDPRRYEDERPAPRYDDRAPRRSEDDRSAPRYDDRAPRGYDDRDVPRRDDRLPPRPTWPGPDERRRPAPADHDPPSLSWAYDDPELPPPPPAVPPSRRRPTPPDPSRTQDLDAPGADRGSRAPDARDATRVSPPEHEQTRVSPRDAGGPTDSGRDPQDDDSAPDRESRRSRRRRPREG